MKRFILIVFTIALCFILMPPAGMAAANSKIYIENTDYRISRTDHVRVPVKLDALPLAALNGENGSYGTGVIFVAFDQTRLEYVGVKPGTMKSVKGKTVTWLTNDQGIANQNGEIRLAFVDNTPDRSTSYGEGSFGLNGQDTVLYLEFAVKQKIVGDLIPVNITRAEFAGNAEPALSSLIGGSTLDMTGGNISFSDYDLVDSFELEVYGTKNNAAYTEKYHFIKNAANSFSIVASPNKEGVVKAKVIPSFNGSGYALEITCADSRIKINGDYIEIPADLTLKQANLAVGIRRPDGTMESGEYILVIVRGNLTATVVKNDINGEVDANDLKGAIDTRADSLAGISTEIKLVITQNTPTAEDMAKVKERAGTDASLLFIDLFLAVTKKDPSGAVLSKDVKQDTTINPVTIRVEIPEDMRGGSNYNIVRLHNGVAEIVPSRKEGNFLVFQTDKFSQYAISFKAAVTGGGGGAGTTPKSPILDPIEKPVVEPKPVVFTDLAGHWAEKGILEFVGLGVIKGYPDGSFRPDAEISRAEFACVLVNALGLKPQKHAVFDDTADHWAKDYINTAAAYGIVVGFDAKTFGPDLRITREQMAVMVGRVKRYAASPDDIIFKDNADISDWARVAVAASVKAGIMVGYPDNSFRPQGVSTRAEAVTVVLRISK